jgi:hypothetical protein
MVAPGLALSIAKGYVAARQGTTLRARCESCLKAEVTSHVASKSNSTSKGQIEGRCYPTCRPLDVALFFLIAAERCWQGRSSRSSNGMQSCSHGMRSLARNAAHVKRYVKRPADNLEHRDLVQWIMEPTRCDAASTTCTTSCPWGTSWRPENIT